MQINLLNLIKLYRVCNIPIKKLSNWETKKCAQVYTASKWRSHAFNPWSLMPESGSYPLDCADGIGYYHHHDQGQ